MNAIVQQLIARVTAPLRDQVGRVVKLAILGAVAAVLSGLVLGFLTAALYLWVRSMQPPIIATLITAGVFLVLLVVVVIVIMTSGAKTHKTVAVAASQKPVAVASSAWQPVIDVLGRAGLRREQAALLAGTEFGKQLKPIHMIGVAFAIGLIAGRRIDRSR